MTNQVYLIGHEEPNGWVGSTGAGNVWSADAKYYDATYSRSALVPGGDYSAGYTLPQVEEEGTEAGFWVSWRYKAYGNAVLGGNGLTFKITNGTYSSVELRNVGQDGSRAVFLRLYRLNSAAYVDSPTVTVNIVVGIAHLFTIHVYTQGGNALADLYFDKVLVASVTAAGTSHTGCKVLTLYGCLYAYSSAGMSEVILTNFDNREQRVKTIAPASAGTYHDQSSGTVLDIDEAVRDGLYVELPTIGNKFSYVPAALGITDERIMALALGATAVAGVGRKMDGLVRLGGTDYPLGTLASGGAVSGGAALMPLCPATGAEWVASDLDGIEYGVESKAL